MSLLSSAGPLVGRLLVAALFAWGGVHKLAAPGGTASLLAAVHVPYATAAAVGAGALELGGALSLALGFKARALALLLLLYVAAATWLFHWPHEMVQVMKNLAIMGGLLGIAAHGPGPMSVNR